MADELRIPVSVDRNSVYEALVPQIKSLVGNEPDFIANVSNIMAALKESLGFLWVGCYFIQNEILVLGPFQGPVACVRIQKGKGVCGSAWEKNETLIVPDVDLFPGHIACSSLSRSEIVIPIRNEENVIIGVLDVDSTELNYFSEKDQKYLEQIADLIGTLQRT